jgi:hypothetical protein
MAQESMIFTDTIQHYKFLRQKSDILVWTFFHGVFWLQCPSTASSTTRWPVTTPHFLQHHLAYKKKGVLFKRSSDNRGSTVLDIWHIFCHVTSVQDAFYLAWFSTYVPTIYKLLWFKNTMVCCNLNFCT